MSYDDDYIRPPDDIISEQLLDDDRSEFEKNIDEALYLSMLEFQKINEINNQYENELIKNYNDETNKRKDLFSNILNDICKLSKLDIKNKETYDLIENIINFYCNQYTNVYNLDEMSYIKVFEILNKIRSAKNIIPIFENFITKDT